MEGKIYLVETRVLASLNFAFPSPFPSCASCSSSMFFLFLLDSIEILLSHSECPKSVCRSTSSS